MRRVRSGSAKLAFSLFVLVALFVGGLFGPSRGTFWPICVAPLSLHTDSGTPRRDISGSKTRSSGGCLSARMPSGAFGLQAEAMTGPT